MKVLGWAIKAARLFDLLSLSLCTTITVVKYSNKDNCCSLGGSLVPLVRQEPHYVVLRRVQISGYNRTVSVVTHSGAFVSR